VNDGVHAAAYAVIKRVAETKVVSAIGGAISSKPLLVNSTTNKRISDVRIATEKLAAEKVMLVSANRVLESRNNTLISEHKDLVRKQKISSAAIRNASGRVAARSIKNAARNFFGMTEEVIPYVGSAVVVAMTALDVEDACNNIKDLNEMNNVVGLANEDSSKICGMTIPTKKEIIDKARDMGKTGYKTAEEYIVELKKISLIK